MKKYITLAALLAAGTTFANAEVQTTVVFDIDRSGDAVTFTEDDSVVSLNYTGWSYSGEGNNNVGSWQTPANAAYSNSFSPDAQLRSGTTDSWTLNFTLTNNGTEDIILTGFTFDAYGINGGGSDKTAVIPVTTTLKTGTSEFDNRTVFTDTSGNPTSYYLDFGGRTTSSTFTLGNIVLAVGETSTFSFTMGDATSYNTYAGLTGGSVTYSVPEPSAFGMLAGAGALALVAARRRRK